MSLGKIEPFDILADSWELYVERLEQYFITKGIVEPCIQVATLITAIGAEAYELLVNLCTPDRPATKTFTVLVKIMREHVQPTPSILAERFKFRQRRQKEGESISEYVAGLKRLSKYCGFDAVRLSENLRDQFVCGLTSDSIRQRLFAENNITFDEAFRLSVTLEAAETDAAKVEMRTTHGGSSSSNKALHQIQQIESGRADRFGTTVLKRAPKSGEVTREGRSIRGREGANPRNTTAVAGYSRQASDSAYGGSSACRACGGQHSSNTCKYRVFVCRVCMTAGHLKRVCPKLRGIHHNEAEAMIGYKEDEEEVFIENFSLNTNFRICLPFIVDIGVNDVILSMEIDTGSSISCISLSCYQQNFEQWKLKRSNLVLRYYTGEMVRPIGMFTPMVTHKNATKSLDLYVIENGKTNLLGRDWITKLDVKWPLALCNKINVVDKTFNLKQFSSRFCKVFEDGLGRFNGGTVGFHLRPEARPIFMRARPIAYALREPVERALDDLLKEGVITPVDSSDWATPIVPVMKKDGNIRVCGDFKITLNKCLEVDRFPLPRVEDLLTKLHGGEKFTKLDFSQAYTQLVLDESKKYAVINTHKGLFRYNRLIFGLASSPAIFQKKIEQLFCDMPQVGIFLDDIIITGRNNEEHINTLTKVFERLERYGLRIKKEKCEFMADSVTYLGYVVSKEGVHTCPKKIEAIKKAAKPKNVSELRSFLGLIMYYAKFVPNISTILSPLYELLRKEVRYEWNDRRESAFQKVKSLLVSSEVLAHYNPELPLILTTDASSVGIGAVISHLMPTECVNTPRERPIAFASRTLNSAERGYSQIEKEALSIIFGIRKFHQYLYGRKFILKTDHKPLVSIFGDKSGIPVMAASRLQRWAVLLSGYDYDIEYVRSDKNAADALSRLPLDVEALESVEVTYVNFVQDFLPITKAVVLEQVSKDTTLQRVIHYIQQGWPNVCDDGDMQPFYTRRNELYVDQGCIVWGYRLIIPSTLRSELLKELHVGHLGIVKMKSIARSYIWWPGIDADVERTGRGCISCNAESAAPPRAQPQPWPYTAEPWTRLHVDFLGPFQGKTFFVLIDSHSKWLEVFPMAKTTAKAVIKNLRETFARFGLPMEVVSDNGPPFSSREFLDFLQINGIKAINSAIYHPASNGAAEAAVKLCKRALKKAIHDGIEVDKALQSYLMAYRNVEHATTGVAPAQLLQNRKLRSRLDLLNVPRDTEDNSSQMQQIKDRVMRSQNRQARFAGGADRHLQVGEPVWARNYKGGDKWVSGRIEEKVGSRNYVISRQSDPPLRRHIDQLRSKWNTTNVPVPEPVAPAGLVIREPIPVEGPPATSTSRARYAPVPPRDHPKRLRKGVDRLGIGR